MAQVFDEALWLPTTGRGVSEADSSSAFFSLAFLAPIHKIG